MATTKLNRIIRDPASWSGDPIVAGTRIPVAFLVVQYEYEQSTAAVLEAFPHLDEDAVHQALQYYQEHRAEIDQIIRLHGIERGTSAEAQSA